MKEVRLFPLLRLDCQPSPYVEPVLNHFSDHPDFDIQIQKVPYEFQRGGNEMMRIWCKKT